MSSRAPDIFVHDRWQYKYRFQDGDRTPIQLMSRGVGKLTKLRSSVIEIVSPGSASKAGVGSLSDIVPARFPSTNWRLPSMSTRCPSGSTFMLTRCCGLSQRKGDSHGSFGFSVPGIPESSRNHEPSQPIR